MSDPWLWWRLAKFVGVAVFAGGVALALAGGTLRVRRHAAHWLATPGFVLTWVAGFALMKLSGRTMEPWITASMATSLLALHAVVAHADAVAPARWSRPAALAGLMASLATMVLRPASGSATLAPIAVGVAIGLALDRLLVRPTLHDDDDPSATWRWFAAVAWIEGLSLLLLTVVSMPLKYGLGVSIDGGTGLLGWTHGVLVFVFVEALWSARRVLAWSGPTVALGLVTSLLPFGSFWFERHQARAREA